MKKLAILAMLAVELAVCGCGNSVPPNTPVTTTTGNWEAQLFGGTGPTSQLNFVTSFAVTVTNGVPNQPLDITGLGFINSGPCFAIGDISQSVSGTTTLNANSAGQVTGTLDLIVASNVTGAVLNLSGNVTGNSNGTTVTTGTLSNGVVVGKWTLTSGPNNTSCTTPANPTFVMCQGSATCTIPE